MDKYWCFFNSSTKISANTKIYAIPQDKVGIIQMYMPFHKTRNGLYRFNLAVILENIYIILSFLLQLYFI